jgi:N-acetylmuramoyl-L-alanine amidase
VSDVIHPRHATHGVLVALAVFAVAALAGCGGGESGTPVQPAPAAASGSAAPAPAKRIVLLDPGHNGGNATHLAQINKKVPDGRGGTKPCNTVGTVTDNGVTEHEFNFDVADDVRDLLQSNGVTVIMTRNDDEGVGPCVDVRGKMDTKVNADLVVSIHADGAPASGHGFHVIYSKPALNSSQGAPSLALATAVRDSMTDQQLATSTYAGKNGLSGRDDLAGLNLARRPAILVECGNMKNAQDAVNMSSDAGQARIAQGIGIGVLKWLAQHPPGSTSLADSSNDSSSDASTSDSSGSDSSSSDSDPETTTTHKHSSSSSSGTSTHSSTSRRSAGAHSTETTTP